MLSDFFLRETPFIGGEEPNIADYAICLQLLILYSTSHPPPDRIRQYLHNAAEHVGNWNEITLPIREFCMFRQKELRQVRRTGGGGVCEGGPGGQRGRALVEGGVLGVSHPPPPPLSDTDC